MDKRKTSKKENIEIKNKEKDIKEEKTEIVKEEHKDNVSEKPPITKFYKRYFSYGERIIIRAVLIVLFLIFAGIFLMGSISIKTTSNVFYSQKGNIDYKVYLEKNDFYDTPYLDSNMQYIASLIDYINVNFQYSFSANKAIDYKYNYYITADTLVTDRENDNKIIYSSTDKIMDDVTVIKDNSSSFYINENLKVDYGHYNSIIQKFKSSYALSAESNLVLTLHVDIYDLKGNKIKDVNDGLVKLTVPLTKQTINISMDTNNVNNSSSAAIYTDFAISNKLFLALSFVCVLLMLVTIVSLIIFMIKTSKKKSIYDITLAKILREYDRLIVTSKKDIDIPEDAVEVENFTELLDVRDNIEKPIVFYEIHKGLKSVFVVKSDVESYKYVLKLADLEKKKNEK